MDDILTAQDRLLKSFAGPDLHVTLLAAACLRAVDAVSLNNVLADPRACVLYRQVCQAALEILRRRQGAGYLVHGPVLRELSRLFDDLLEAHSVPQISLGARAIAQALHLDRGSHFWSYFSAWPQPRLLLPGDPVPVPTLSTLQDIYKSPLRLSPCPDTRDTPHGLCPGGYRGLPSLRLAPAAPAELWLDPSLPRDLCPLTPRADHPGTGVVALVLPAPDLDSTYTYNVDTDEHGELGFDQVMPKDAVTAQATISEATRRAAQHAALVVMPELTNTPHVEESIDALREGGDLTNVHVLVGGSSWRPAEDGARSGSNRAKIWPRGRPYHQHEKYSWFRDKSAGAERIGHRKRITVMAGQRHTYTVLICKDALENWVPAVLQELRVRLVVVPSCNSGVRTYDAVGRSLADLGWSTVVLANIPPDARSPREFGLLVRPACEATDHEASYVTVREVVGNYSRIVSIDMSTLGVVCG